MCSLVVPVVISVIATGGIDMTLRTHIGNAPIKKTVLPGYSVEKGTSPEIERT